jgi:hypothetical protein
VASFLLTFPPISIPLRPHSCYISCPASFLILANSSIILDTDGAVKRTTERNLGKFSGGPTFRKKERGDMLQLRWLVIRYYNTVSITMQFILDL